MPRHRKPVELRANRETKDVGMLAPEPPIAEGPPPPSGLLKSSRDAWIAFWRSPLARMVKPDSDLPGLARLWSLQDERARAYRAIRSERMVAGSKGQPRANPLFGVLAMLDSEIRQLEDRYGLSPRARLNLGVSFGDGKPSLDDLNAGLQADDPSDFDDPGDLDDAEGADPRLLVMDGGAG